MNINEIGEIMDKTNFKFARLCSPDKFMDYWFKTDTVSDNELSKKYMEQSMVGVTEVVYSKYSDVIGVKRIFPFNFDVITPDDQELKNILKELVEEMNMV